MNSIGLYELQRNEKYTWFISSDPNCGLLNMNRSFVPQCEHFGTKRSIRNDSDPNYCNINKKRVDGSFLAREYFNASIDSPEEFKGFTTRKCLPETAINGGFCKNENETKAVWVKWIDSRLTFAQCLKACEDLGGILYPDLDGDSKQIYFLTRYTNKAYWVGVTTDGKWYLWKNLRGERMTPDRLAWNKFEYRVDSEAVRTRFMYPNVVMRELSDEGRVVCQMLV